MGTFIWVVIIAVWIISVVLKKNRMTWVDLFQKIEQFQKGQGPVKASFNETTGSYTTTSSPSEKSSLTTFVSMLKKRIFLVVGVLAVSILLFNMIVIIPAGTTGVQHLFGKVRDNELKSGIHLINPLVVVERMSIRTEQYTMSIAPAEGQVKGDDSISSLTKEGLDVNIDFTALYRLEEDRAAEIYREVGLDYVGKLIRPEIRGVIRDVVSQYEAKDLYSEKRQEASLRMETMLKERLEGRGIVIEQAVIRNVQLPASLAKAIQEKLASEQESQRYDFVLEKEKKEADRKRIEAEGQRDAQRIIDESLSPGYLNYLYIKELKDRDGTIYVPVDPTNGLPMFKGVE
jgi:regulator of protease activity HflC (stomatin/prohibitin superfamily)